MRNVMYTYATELIGAEYQNVTTAQSLKNKLRGP
jgi:hypothetical protein